MNITAFRNILKKYDKIYAPDEIDRMIADVRPNFRIFKTWKIADGVVSKIKYFDVPAAFDIETSSFYYNGEKCACMYEWTLGIFGAVMIGRTWDEFISVMKKIVEILDLHREKRVVIYVHNLAYEFQFIRKWFEWETIFAIDTRKPIYALTTSGIEFRCSYLLTGYNLETVAKNLKTIQLRKRVGDLDYSLIRHSRTPLSDLEIGYCVDDVKIVMADIAERIVASGNITKIPLTKTGYVRQYCRGRCFGEYDGTKA